MPYTAMYRKFRPRTFSEIQGQDHIVTALRNQIRSDRIGHAYLFCGTRGTGKTTAAKILAKAVNCEHPINGEPCGKCQSCMGIQKGVLTNVVEIDAASNNGVDNIRDIKEQVKYSPQEGKYRVFIIDEVHMLSVGAFNALLKTLEEPPSYVIFILATTEVHKIPTTILSRCQRYDFHRITVAVITRQLKNLSEQEGIEIEEKALRYIAKLADGSMRDALSLLDQCIAFYLGKSITYENVLDVLGREDIIFYDKLLDDILHCDVESMMQKIEDAGNQGIEWSRFVTEFLQYMRNLLLAGTNDLGMDALDLSKENLDMLQQRAKQLDEAILIRYIRICSDLLNKLRFSSSRRILVEVEFIKLCKPAMDIEPDIGTIKDQMRQMQDEITQLKQGIMTKTIPVESTRLQNNIHSQEKTGTVEEHNDRKIGLEEFFKAWYQIKRTLPVQIRSCLNHASVLPGEEGSVRILFSENDLVEYHYVERNLEELEKTIKNLLHGDIRIQLESYQEKNEYDLSLIHMDVTII